MEPGARQRARRHSFSANIAVPKPTLFATNHKPPATMCRRPERRWREKPRFRAARTSLCLLPARLPLLDISLAYIALAQFALAQFALAQFAALALHQFPQVIEL